jgi:outer membrane protein assembly factor BamA
MDAGNVWLVREDTLRQGGKIEFDKILQTSSVSVGTGLRYDFSVIAIRLDLGLPIKYPYREERGDVYGDTELIDWNRFGKTMILHFAIDYPF